MIDDSSRTGKDIVHSTPGEDTQKGEELFLSDDFHKELNRLADSERQGYQGSDPGVLARLALEKRIKKAKRKRRLFWGMILLLAALLGGLYYLATTYIKPIRDQHVRMCAISAGEGNYFATGQRVYDYGYYSLFGFQIVDNSTRTEKTEVNINGQKMIVVGISGKDYKTVHVGQGEKGRQVLERAEQYVFVINDQVKMISYEGFCR